MIKDSNAKLKSENSNLKSENAHLKAKIYNQDQQAKQVIFKQINQL